MFLNVDEKTIIARIAEGDSEAENYLFSCFKERIQFLVRIRTRGNIPKQDQEDIISETHHAILLSLRKGGFDPEREKDKKLSPHSLPCRQTDGIFPIDRDKLLNST